MRWFSHSVICFAAVLGFGSGVHAADITPYNSIVPFQQDRWIGFKDFTLRYVGTRVVEPHGRVVIPITFHQFDVNGADGMKRVEWSSGMGEISPQAFSVGTHNFFLEMQSSLLPSDTGQRGTSLGTYELVILTEAKQKELWQLMLNGYKAR